MDHIGSKTTECYSKTLNHYELILSQTPYLKKNPIHVSNIAFNVDVNLKAIVTQSFIFPY